MQQGLPLLVLGRAAKSLGVIFKSLPLHQQQVLVALLHADLQLVTKVARHGADEGAGLSEGLLKGGFLTRDHSEWGDFQYHIDSLFPGPMTRAAIKGGGMSVCPWQDAAEGGPTIGGRALVCRYQQAGTVCL